MAMNANKVQNDVQLALDLFGLDPLIDRDFTHTLSLYDVIGKYIYDRRSKILTGVTSAADAKFQRKIIHGNAEITATITAANIERIGKNGEKESVFAFPGTREQAIEDVLRKLATERRAETYETQLPNKKKKFHLIGLQFSLYEIHQELERQGKSYNYVEIREGLEILSKAGLSFVSEDGSTLANANFFPVLFFADAPKKGDAQAFVCFHPLVTDLITNTKYRRSKYSKLFEFQSQRARLFYDRLCCSWIQAGPGRPYNILLTTLIAAWKDPANRLAKDKEVIIEALNELVERDIIEKYEAEPKKNKGKIYDWLFTLHASNSFAKQQAAAQKVFNQITAKAEGRALMSDEGQSQDNEHDNSESKSSQIPF